MWIQKEKKKEKDFLSFYEELRNILKRVQIDIKIED